MDRNQSFLPVNLIQDTVKSNWILFFLAHDYSAAHDLPVIRLFFNKIFKSLFSLNLKLHSIKHESTTMQLILQAFKMTLGLYACYNIICF